MPIAGDGVTSVVYKVKGVVTLKTPDITVDSGSALRYEGDLALRKLSTDVYLAQFLNFGIVKFDKVAGDVKDPFLLPVEKSSRSSELGDYDSYFQHPVKFYLKEGKVRDLQIRWLIASPPLRLMNCSVIAVRILADQGDKLASLVKNHK